MKMNWKIGVATLTLLSNLVAVQAEAQGNQADKRQEIVMSRIWWNQDQKIKALSLTKEQRRKMDAHLKAYLDERRVQAQEKDVYQELRDALGNSDMEAAGAAQEKILEHLSAPMRSQIDLMITASGELNDEQRKQIAEDYPKLFTRPWVRFAAGGGRAPEGARAGRRAGGNG